MLEGEWTFLAGEMLMHALVCWLAWWVFAQGKAGGRGLAAATLVACFTGGALIELATVMVPQIGNFYHAQVAVQLFGLREPLYMLVGCCTWIPATALLLTRTLRLPTLPAEACLAGLLAHFSWGLLQKDLDGYAGSSQTAPTSTRNTEQKRKTCTTSANNRLNTSSTDFVVIIEQAKQQTGDLLPQHLPPSERDPEVVPRR